ERHAGGAGLSLVRLCEVRQDSQDRSRNGRQESQVQPLWRDHARPRERGRRSTRRVYRQVSSAFSAMSWCPAGDHLCADSLGHAPERRHCWLRDLRQAPRQSLQRELQNRSVLIQGDGLCQRLWALDRLLYLWHQRRGLTKTQKALPAASWQQPKGRNRSVLTPAK